MASCNKFSLVLFGGGLVAAAGCLTTKTSTPESAVTAPTSKGAWNLPGRSPHLVAHYMPWFEIEPPGGTAAKPKKPLATRLPSSWYEDRSPGPDARSWRHWKWTSGGPARNPEELAESGLRKISSIQYPLIGPYSSRSLNVVRYHLETAKAAGIEAFMVIWYGPHSFEDEQVPLLLDEAQRAGMRISICYEEKINFPGYRELDSRDEIVSSVVEDLNYIIDRYASHPAYLKRDGVPFIFQFNGWGKGPLGPNFLTPAEWKDVFAELHSPILYGRQNIDEEYHPPIQAAYNWWSISPDWLRSITHRAAELKQSGRLLFFMTMICPGFDDTGVWGWGNGPRKNERFGLSVLKDTFDRSFAGNPELIQVVTWNDFAEGTAVEPTRENGFWYLDALETWWGEKTGRPVDLSDNRLAFIYYAANASAGEKAELPDTPFDSFLEQKPLVVEKPDVLKSLQ